MSKPNPVIEAKSQLVEYIEAGSKPDRSSWRIGSEHEKFIFYRPDNSALSYKAQGDKPGVEDVIKAFVSRGWMPVEENGYLIAALKDGASITLEPGGQFELSGAPLKTIHDTCNETTAHLRASQEIGEQLNIGFLGMGFHPTLKREEIPVMPKARYDIMRAYMPKKGNLGLDMMLRTCTVQVNLDFASEADMVEKFRIGLALQPLATALFANSPLKEGQSNGMRSFRSQVWTDTDPDRCGMLPFVFEDGMGFERWVDHVLDVPMYFTKRGDKYVDASGQSFRDFMKGELPALPGELPTMKDWEDHLTTLFPEVRLKTFLEMRGADGGPWSRLCALPAFWVGLLYDAGAQAATLDIIKNWSVAELEKLRLDAPVEGLNASIGGQSLQVIGKEVLAVANEGLKARAALSISGDSEQGFLNSLHESVETGMVPADQVLADLNGPWQGDLSKVFSELSY
jgi:glutamate--cysteine ligase